MLSRADLLNADDKSKEMRHEEEAGGDHQAEEFLQKGALSKIMTMIVMIPKRI